MTDKITLAFSGDILSYRCQNRELKRKFGRYDYGTVYERVAPLLSRADYAVGSLETPVAGSAAGFTRDAIVFNTPEEILSALKDCGFDMLTTANNHCLDRGIDGLAATIDALGRHGFDYTGTRLDAGEPPFLLKNIGGVRVAFVAYTYGTNYSAHLNRLEPGQTHMVNMFKPQPPAIYRPAYKRMLIEAFKRYAPMPLQMRLRPPFPTAKIADCGSPAELECGEMAAMERTIAEARRQADVVVALPHVGGQFNDVVGESSRAVVSRCVRAGADAVVANHSHAVLPIEQIDGAWVAHCLGNFSFTPGDGYYYGDVHADYSLLLYLEIDKATLRATPSFSVLKNVVGCDGISRVVPVADLPSTDLADVNAVHRRATGCDCDEIAPCYAVQCAIGVRSDLGRPTTPARTNKEDFMRRLQRLS